ncbi:MULTISPECIES: AMP-binding protein [unclassified Pseudovibrio]|uniref:AMP-binding protein n=1 Tax=unclassified Pseudovibrio TaxID=2627060 RepID=UPI00070BB640|nr:MULTISPECIES: AMP-binding protein [unclassified Pseudovibrio]KZL15198.1 Long-chain-fatty-acid--CoA ligase FadD13 [Pseudovibrio sp. Ad26]
MHNDLSFTTIGHLCKWAAQTYGTMPALEEGRTYSFIELDELRQQAARALIALGVKKGDRVMVWGPNTWHWVVAALGLVSIGAILIPASTRFKASEMDDLIERSGTPLLFSAGQFLGKYYPQELADKTRSGLNQLVIMGEAQDERDCGWQAFLEKGNSISAQQLHDVEQSVGPDDLCDMLFTSGTTGFPKGVMFGHKQCLMGVDGWADRVGLTKGDRVLVIPPFFHAFGYRCGVLVCLLRGATLIPHLTYQPDEILSRIETSGISVIPGPPAIFQGMLQEENLGQYNLSTLRVGVTGGAVIPPALIRDMRQILGFKDVVSGYGLTECGGFGTMCSADDDDETIATTAGRPQPGLEVAIKDTSGSILPAETTGEVVIRGYAVMQGYFNNEEATQEIIDEQGYLHTGDLGQLDKDGNLKIKGRLKDMYICGGFNCYPAEIERLLSSNPAIGSAAVIGIADDRLGEVGCAFVVLKPGHQLSAEEVISWARDHMANFKCPRRVEIVKTLPLSAQSKVRKQDLYELLNNRAEALVE